MEVKKAMKKCGTGAKMECKESRKEEKKRNK